MIDLNWVDEKTDSRGYSLEQIQQAREQQSKAVQASYQQLIGRKADMRAEAQTLMQILGGTGNSFAKLQEAVGWLDTATDAPHVASALQALDQALQLARPDAAEVQYLHRLNASALAAQQAQQRQAERSQPKAPPTVEALASEVARLTGEVAEQRRRLDRCEEIFKGYLGVE